MIKQLTAMPKYEAYKDSGVEWLGEIPKHWDLSKLGSCLKSVSVKNRPDLPLLSITREKGVIQRNVEDQDENHNYIPDDLSNYKVLKRGQFGMNKMKAWQGSYGVSDHTGIVSPAYFIFDFVKDIDPKFFHLAIRSRLYISYFGSASDGVRIGQWDLSKPRMKEIPFLIPKLPEQIAIAAFLDHKTAQIDQAMAIKEKQIALLKERKQVLIQNAVTRGLDPNVPMRDSGVEWIGEIPDHWKVKRLKYICNEIQTGTTPVTSNPKYFDGSVNWYNPKDLNEAYLKDSEKKISELAIYRNEAKLFNADSVLIVGIGATTGKTSYLPIKASFNQQITGFHSNSECNKYLFFLLRSFSEVMLRVASYTTLPILNNEFFKSFWIPEPPIEEQIAIVSHIEIESNKVDRVISIQQQQIDKLKEYKTTLINSAVTGKIRVPELVEGRVPEVSIPEPVEGELVEAGVA